MEVRDETHAYELEVTPKKKEDPQIFVALKQARRAHKLHRKPHISRSYPLRLVM